MKVAPWKFGTVTRTRLHLVTALLALLGILPRCLSQTYLPSQINPYETRAAELRRNFPADAPAQAVALAKEYALLDHVSDVDAVSAWLKSVAENGTLTAAVREEAGRYVALMDLQAGKLEAAQADWNRLRLLRNWTVAGPFTGELPAQMEKGFRAGEVKTARSVPEVGPRGTLELSHYYPEVSAGLVAAATTIHADAAGQVTLRIGSDGPITVWVNGKQLLDIDADAAFHFDQHVIAADLQAGDNTVVVALRRTTQGQWRLSARVSADATDLLREAQKAAEEQPSSVEALDTLAEMEQLRGRAEAHDTFERAARLKASAERWLRVASACGNPNCTYQALSAAENIAPKDANVVGSLAEYYAGRGQTQKARTLLTQGIEAAPTDFTLRMRLAELFLASGRNAEALNEMQRLEQQFPAVPWLARRLAAKYAEQGMFARAQSNYSDALAREFNDNAAREGLATIFARQQDSIRLRGLYSDALKADASDVRTLARLAKLDAGIGNSAAAEAVLEKALSLAPNDSKLRVQQADMLAAAGRTVEARTELARAADVAPNDEKLHARLKAESGDPTADPDGAYVADAAQLAAQTRRSSPKDGGNAVELADVRVERVTSNGLSTLRLQQVVYVANDQGAREYASRAISYATGSQKLQILHARVFKSDGRVVGAEDEGESGGSDSASAMYYDTRSRSLHYPSLEKGDVVELDYRLLPEGTANPYGDYFGELVTFGSSLPRKLQRYVLIAPNSLALHVTEERLGKAVESQSNGTHVYSWEMKNLAPLPSEPRGPATTEVAPYVHVSTFDSWNEVGRWYARLIAPQFKLDAALREALAKITADKTTDRDKITAIHHFVLRNTHYVALEFGIFSYKPYPVAQVYARRFGDCKDKASLMIALLRASGIDADMALVRTRRLGDVATDATSVSVFNHAVVYIPKYDLWLDGTAEYAGSHELPLDDQGAQALTVALDGTSQLRRIPVTLPMENYTHRQVRAQLERDGRIQFTGSAYTRGEDAPGLRRDYEVAERQRTSFRNRLAEVLPSVRLDSVEVDGAHDLESDVVVNFSGDLDTYAGKRSVSLMPSWMTRSYVQTLAPLTSRNEELILPAPWTTEEELHFVLPSEARIESLPSDTNLDTPFGSAVVRYHRQGDEVVVKTSVQFRKLRIAPADYAAFRNFCLQVESAFRGEIKVGL